MRLSAADWERENMSEIFEAVMIILFGVSWPISIVKSYRSRTAKGKSVFFLFLILFGYAAGIVSKLVSANITYVLILYVVNLAAVAVDLCLYFRNKRLDMLQISNPESGQTNA